MVGHRHCIHALITFMLTACAWAAEPAPSGTVSAPAKTVPPSFDLNSDAVRKVVRATAATQSSSDYRIDAPRREEPDPAGALRENPEKPRREVPEPRLPEYVRCDGFLTCGLRTLLGGDDSWDWRHERFRDPRIAASTHGYDALFSCQDANNLLTPTQRHAACGTVPID
jgi:hypothetical protein